MNDLDRTELFLAEGMRALNLESTISTEHESDTEAWVNLDNLGISVFVDAEGGRRRSIKGEIKVTEWQVYTVQTVSATRHEPEDVDLNFRRSFTNIQDAIAEIFALVTRDTILGMLETVKIGR